jgi:deoxyribodipyrimidine photo-lyase
MREPEAWRRSATMKLSLPLWTVDADVILPSKLLEKVQYAAHLIRPRLQAQLGRFLVPHKNTKAKVAWRRPEGLQSLDSDFEITQGWPLDTSVGPVSGFRGGTNEALTLLEEFIKTGYQHMALNATSRR